MRLIGCKGIEPKQLSSDFIMDAKTDNFKREEVIVNYYPMVYKLVKKYYLQDIPSLDWDDLNSIGLISINKAIDKFDPNSEASFTTYCYSLIRGYIGSEVRKYSYAKTGELNQHITSIQYIESTGVEFANLVVDEVDYEEMAIKTKPTPKNGWAMVRRRLDKEQYKIITNVYKKDKKKSEVAKEMGMSPQSMNARLRTIEKRLRTIPKEKLYNSFGIDMEG